MSKLQEAFERGEDTDDVVGKASMVTPVPAGVGSVTTSILAKHVIKACKQQNNK